MDDPQEIRGINSRTELAEVGMLVRQKKNEELMAAGVTLVDPATTYIDPRVEIGADTVIHPGVVIEGPDAHRARLRDPGARADRRRRDRRPREHQQLLRHRRVADRQRRQRRAVRASAAGDRRSARAPRSATSSS